MANHTVLTGDRVEMYAVTDPLDDQARSETLIGATTDNIEIERSPNSADWAEHMNDFMQRRELQEEGEMTAVFLLTATLDNLVDANVYEEDADNEIYRPRRNYRHDAVEFDVYDPDEEVVQQTYRALDAQPVVETIDMDIEGPVVVECLFWLQGAHGWVSDNVGTDASST